MSSNWNHDTSYAGLPTISLCSERTPVLPSIHHLTMFTCGLHIDSGNSGCGIGSPPASAYVVCTTHPSGVFTTIVTTCSGLPFLSHLSTVSTLESHTPSNEGSTVNSCIGSSKLKYVVLLVVSTQSHQTCSKLVITFLIIGNHADIVILSITCSSELHTVSVSTLGEQSTQPHPIALARSFKAHLVNQTLSDFSDVCVRATVTPPSNNELSYANSVASDPQIVTTHASCI